MLKIIEYLVKPEYIEDALQWSLKRVNMPEEIKNYLGRSTVNV